MARENFSRNVRNKIAHSAGHQCSFPGCNQRTVGPGPTSEYISNSGYAAHIFSASKGGPRGQGGLSPAEIRGASNGIWLCGRHAKLVDNNKGAAYPAETLLSFKALHEARVQLEHEGLYPPIGWLHELEIVRSPLFESGQKFQLSKLNLIYGPNSTGKTAITEWISGFFDPSELDRWVTTRKENLDLRLSILNPKPQRMRLTARDLQIKYDIDGRFVSFIPLGFRIIKPQALDFSISDDIEMFAQSLGFPSMTIESLFDDVNQFPYSTVTNLRIEFATDNDDILTDQRTVLGDVQGTTPGLRFRLLSSYEQGQVMIEFATAAARLSGRYCPTLLILDGIMSSIFEGFFRPVLPPSTRPNKSVSDIDVCSRLRARP